MSTCSNKDILKINSGGCGFYALYLNSVRPNTSIINFYSSNRPRRHFMVYDGIYYYDCTGKTKYPKWLIYKHRNISREYLQSIVYDSHWNPAFNRSDTIYFPLINQY
jgi:hypothetical protein